MSRLKPFALLLALHLGCGAEAGGKNDNALFIAPRASRSSAIAITPDDSLVIMANPDHGSISVFRTEDNSLLATAMTGSEPSSVVIHPDGDTAFVANRADGTVVKVTGIASGNIDVSDPLPVGSEPTGLALSPTGKRLFVAEWAEGRVSVVETQSMVIRTTLDNPENPRALAVTNDLDADEADETLVVAEFFGEITAGGEVADDGRQGRIRLYSLADLASSGSIIFQPRDSGFAPPGGANVTTSPNQLYGVTINEGKIYVPSVSASPEAPIRFNVNVQPVLYVGDLATSLEDTGPSGTANLARLVGDALPPGQTRFFLADIVDVDFAPGNFAYVVSRGANVLQRVVYEPNGIKIGSQFNTQIDLNAAPDGSAAGCLGPNAVVVAHQRPTAYVNCWVNRRLGVVNLAEQRLLATLESSPAPATPVAIAQEKGKKFFFTGRGRWSNEAWSACSSCHPDGLTDNITWAFGAGPRQTTSMDGSFSKGAGEQKQRIFNWTGIFDEMHDFERNTRGVSGGLGAVTTGECGNLAAETQLAVGGNLAQPVKEVQATGCTTDWDDVEAWAKTIRPPRRRQGLDPEAVARGRALFGLSGGNSNGECVKCHGGPGWTASRRFFTPSSAGNADLAAQTFTRPLVWPASWNLHTLQIAAQPAAADNNAAVAPTQVACVIRNVGTFGSPGDQALTDAFELKDTGTRAQGRGGYNIPSMYGLAVGAPYLHHGQAKTLDELFTDPRWGEHLRAGNAVFSPTEQDRSDLIQFLLSIDANTLEEALPTGFDGCPL